MNRDLLAMQMLSKTQAELPMNQYCRQRRELMASEALWGLQQSHWGQVFRSDAVQDPIFRKLFWTRRVVVPHLNCGQVA